jgi:hypothetical protein
MTELHESSVVAAAPNHLSADLDRKAVVLGLDRGLYYGLDRVGSRIWSLVQEPISVGEICSKITSEYDVEQERFMRDLEAFLADLIHEGMIELRA